MTSLRVVIAPDKLKGSLSAPDAAEAIRKGVRKACPDANVDCAPIADGGEGTVEALVAATGGRFREVAVTGPLGVPVRARYGLLGDGRTAVIEMAAASGLVLVPPDLRDPLAASTFGTGELLRDALEQGLTRVVLGIGGSATNDGGAGLAQSLGYRLLDAEGHELPRGGGALARLDRIEAADAVALPPDLEVLVACDVDNPLCGPRGAAAVYGPQKGATPAMVSQLDANLARFARVIARDLGRDVAELPGAGAAGGLGAGLVAFIGGRLERGVDLVLNAVGLGQRLQGADLCLTAEGAIDASSAFGKATVGVGRLARALGCPTIAIVGTIGPGFEAVHAEGIDAIFSLCPRPIPLRDALSQAAPLLTRASNQVVRAFMAGRRRSGGRT